MNLLLDFLFVFKYGFIFRYMSIKAILTSTILQNYNLSSEVGHMRRHTDPPNVLILPVGTRLIYEYTRLQRREKKNTSGDASFVRVTCPLFAVSGLTTNDS